MSDYSFDICGTYECQNGLMVRVIGREGLHMKGYETLICDDGRARYDRSTDGDCDAGRVTGTNHDYSHEFNFKRAKS